MESATRTLMKRCLCGREKITKVFRLVVTSRDAHFFNPLRTCKTWNLKSHSIRRHPFPQGYIPRPSASEGHLHPFSHTKRPFAHFKRCFGVFPLEKPNKKI